MNEKISIFDIISKVEDYWEGLNEKRKREILRYFILIVFILIIVLSLILLIEKLTEKATISELGILNTISTLETDRTYIVLQNGYISEGIKSSDIIGLLLGETIKEYEVMDAFHELYSMAKNNEEHRTELVIPKGAGATELDYNGIKIYIYGWNTTISNFFGEKQTIHIVLIVEDSYIECEAEDKQSNIIELFRDVSMSAKTGIVVWE